jgi:hypothetical protein
MPYNLIEDNILEEPAAYIFTLNSDDGGQQVCPKNYLIYQTTWQNNPEDNYLHIHHCENLISHMVKKFSAFYRT